MCERNRMHDGKIRTIVQCGWRQPMIPENIFPAHIREKNDGSWLIQTVEEHLRQTAQIAAKIGKAYGLEAAGYLVGIVHDAGKLCDKFKKYIVKAANHEPVRRGSVNHTFAGVRLLMAQHGTHACAGHRRYRSHTSGRLRSPASCIPARCPRCQS